MPTPLPLSTPPSGDLKNVICDPRMLAEMTTARSAELALCDLGCVLSPAHDRLWTVPAGKIRAAKKIARENLYPAAFRSALAKVSP